MKIYQGDNLKVLKTLASESIDCCVTSPPYWGLRDYEVKGQFGLEKTFQEYITKLCDIFDEIKRVLKKSGTCWVNMGDSYGGSQSGGIEDSKAAQHGTGATSLGRHRPSYKILPKSLLQIPSRFSIEMCNRRWMLRNIIIWYKSNCMPSSVKDRFTVDFEYIFFFVKNKKYWFERQYESYTEPMDRWGGEKLIAKGKSKKDLQGMYRDRNMRPNKLGRNKRCVWKIPTRPFKGAHFAVFPEGLIETPIKAGCPKGGVVLDPFMGSGTTGVVAMKQEKDFIGIELNPNYIKIAKRRLEKSKTLFNQGEIICLRNT